MVLGFRDKNESILDSLKVFYLSGVHTQKERVNYIGLARTVNVAQVDNEVDAVLKSSIRWILLR